MSDDDAPTLDEVWSQIEEAAHLLDGAIDSLTSIRYARDDLARDDLVWVSDVVARAWARCRESMTALTSLSTTGTR